MDRFAAPLDTTKDWDDLLLDLEARRQVEEIVTWVSHERPLSKPWLFCGGDAAHVAALIGKARKKRVWRVALEALTDAQIGAIFDHAGDAILFFDEADALFGKRTESRDAQDRSANQQFGYLLQRIEDFPGVVILATNLRTHIDEAFARRFQSVIHFVKQPSGA